MSKTNGKLKDEVDALFKLPLPEFTAARNSLAARLKQGGRANDANLVKTLAKPSISAWAVNQLYWEQRDAFDQLLATGQRFHQAQTSRTAPKMADIRGSLDARRGALSHLSDLATELLRDAGHNPTPDTIHRITTTLEAVSAYASLSDGPTLGRLTHDVDPPGFEAFAGLMPVPGTKTTDKKPAKVALSTKLSSAVTKPQPKASPRAEATEQRRLEETRRITIAAAKLSLQDARRLLAEARPRTQRLEAAQKKANAEAKQAGAKAKQAEKHLREAEAAFQKASALSENAAQRAQQLAAEAASAAQALEDARRTVEAASKELESLFRES